MYRRVCVQCMWKSNKIDVNLPFFSSITLKSFRSRFIINKYVNGIAISMCKHLLFAFSIADGNIALLCKKSAQQDEWKKIENFIVIKIGEKEKVSLKPFLLIEFLLDEIHSVQLKKCFHLWSTLIASPDDDATVLMLHKKTNLRYIFFLFYKKLQFTSGELLQAIDSFNIYWET